MIQRNSSNFGSLRPFLYFPFAFNTTYAASSFSFCITKLIHLFILAKSNRFVEVVFVMGSKTAETFDRVKSIVDTMIDSPNNLKTQYGIVEYGDRSEVIRTLGDYSDNLELKDVVKDMKWKTRGRDVITALINAQKMLKSDDRPEVLQRMVVFVDSPAMYGAVEQIKEAYRRLNIKIVTVLVGELAEEVTPKDGDVVDVPSTEPGKTSLAIAKGTFVGKSHCYYHSQPTHTLGCNHTYIHNHTGDSHTHIDTLTLTMTFALTPAPAPTLTPASALTPTFTSTHTNTYQHLHRYSHSYLHCH